MVLTAGGVLFLAVVQWITDTDRLTAGATWGAMLRWSIPVMMAGLSRSTNPGVLSTSEMLEPVMSRPMARSRASPPFTHANPPD